MPLGMEENVTVDSHVLKVRGVGDFKGCKKALLPLLFPSSELEKEGERPSLSLQEKLGRKFTTFHRYMLLKC